VKARIVRAVEPIDGGVRLTLDGLPQPVDIAGDRRVRVQMMGLR
jgi:hypothetical protein